MGLYPHSHFTILAVLFIQQLRKRQFTDKYKGAFIRGNFCGQHAWVLGIGEALQLVTLWLGTSYAHVHVGETFKYRGQGS